MDAHGPAGPGSVVVLRHEGNLGPGCLRHVSEASAWPSIINLYSSTTDSFDLQQGWQRQGRTVIQRTIDEFVTEARREEHGESRRVLLLGLEQLKSPLATRAIEGFADDPELSKAPSRLLRER